MKILALNCGSSSVKYQVFDWSVRNCIAKGQMDRIGSSNALLKHQVGENEALKRELPIRDHEEAIEVVLNAVMASLRGGEKIDAVGHRVVHGGSEFARSVRISDELLATLEKLTPLAPLHNPSNIAGIKAVTRLLPGVPQVGVFDTAFHQTMPAEAYMYAVPRGWIDEHGVRRYGFHGTSHLYVSRKVAQLLGRPVSELRIVTCHIGNGASVTAVKGGKSIDTSMGLTPLEGAVMGTRSGNLDPGVIPYVMAQTNQSFESVYNSLNKESGMLGLTGYNDLRDIEAGHAKGDQRCTDALKTYAYRIKKYIGEYAAAMDGMDVIVFTAGVGENSALVRELVLKDMGYLGVFLDEEANRGAVGGKQAVITAEHSPVKVAVLRTNEELMIVEDTVAILNDKSPGAPGFQYSFETEAPVWNGHAPNGLHFNHHMIHGYHEFQVPVAVSNRHVHLSRADIDILFGKDYQLTPIRPLVQPGQYASAETVTLIGTKGQLEKVRVLGPERKSSQVEISRTDAIKLGVEAPVRDSGDVAGSGEIMIRGTKGELILKEGTILSVRHIHMHTEDAKRFGVRDRDRVRVRTLGDRPVVFENVLVRAHESFALEMHIDTDEANASLIKNGDKAILCVD